MADAKIELFPVNFQEQLREVWTSLRKAEINASSRGQWVKHIRGRSDEGMEISDSNQNQWTKDEDSVLSRLVNEMGSKDWKTISEAFHKTGNESRSRKQIRERWTGYLDPKLDKLPWTLQEELELFERHKELGNKWALIAQKLPGRAESVVKNHFYAVLTRTIRRRKKGFEGKVPFEKHNAPSHILHDLRSKYARQLLKMAKASAVVTSPANEPCRLGMELDKEKPMFQLPEVSELKAVMDFEKWGYSVDWKCLGGEGENGGAERSIKAPSDEIIVSFISFT